MADLIHKPQDSSWFHKTCIETQFPGETFLAMINYRHKFGSLPGGFIFVPSVHSTKHTKNEILGRNGHCSFVNKSPDQFTVLITKFPTSFIFSAKLIGLSELLTRFINSHKVLHTYKLIFYISLLALL